MSLFPAYKLTTEPKENATSPRTKPSQDVSSQDAANHIYPQPVSKKTTVGLLNGDTVHYQLDLSWLNNPSFNPESCVLKDEQSSETGPKLSTVHDGDKSPSKHQKKKKKEKKRKKQSGCKKNIDCKTPSHSIIILESDPFFEDKKREKGNFLVDTLYRPAIPRYDKSGHSFQKYKFWKKKLKRQKNRVKRYFVSSQNSKENNAVENSSDPNFLEGELTKTTEEFNKRLAENPADIDGWLEYARFQDTVYEFEKACRKSDASGERVTTERKLAILERAIEKNPACERLMSERLELAACTLPVERLVDECTRALMQDPGSMMLWRALVRATRDNMARCTVPGVLAAYAKAITRISKLRLFRPHQAVETDILQLMVECGVFLREAGLYEQLWLMLQMYLSLTLTASGQFTVPLKVDESKLRQEEDIIVTSGLPLSVLWLRVEKLRAAHHFLPEPECDSDPQRVVFTDDVAGLVQPVMSPELRLRLVVSAVWLLKVPLLPTSHCLYQCLGLHLNPAAASIETLLTAASANSLYNCRYMRGMPELASEPNWVTEPLYLGWVVAVMRHSADLLPPQQAVCVHVWTLRFFALLCRLHSLDLGPPASVVKQARSYAKQLLKLPQFRENLLLYTEYAMLEVASGDLSRGSGVLQTAAVLPQGAALPPESDGDFIYLCRQLIHCLLLQNTVSNKAEVGNVLRRLADDTAWSQKTANLVEQNLCRASEPLTIEAAMMPALLVDWLACHSQHVSLSQSGFEAVALLRETIERIPNTPGTMGSLWVEQLYGVMADILYSHCTQTKTNYSLLRDTLVTTIASFPNNIPLLHMLATIETVAGGGGTPMWKLVNFFPKSSPLARLMLVFVVRCRITAGEWVSSGGDHYLRSMTRQLTDEQTTGRCPMAWRLRLQLAAATEPATRLKLVFYQCLQACPWVKTFYLDAVKFLPEDMAEIHDLLIEKELRLHITPEELDVLRN